MINAKELRIGNYVKCKISNDSAIYSVTQLSYSAVVLNGVRDKEVIPIQKIKPISLSIDWLIKMGFEYSGYYLKDNVRVFLYGITNVTFHDVDILDSDDEHVEFKTIHQLQNYFFAKTGKELEL